MVNFVVEALIFFRSGTEDYSERDTLLQEASGLCREFNFVGLERQKKKTPRDVQLSQLGKNVRNSYLGHQVEQRKENASTSIQQVCNQDNDDSFFQEMSTCDQENDFFMSDHDYGKYFSTPKMFLYKKK